MCILLSQSVETRVRKAEAALAAAKRSVETAEKASAAADKKLQT